MKPQNFNSQPLPNLFRSKIWLDAWLHAWGKTFKENPNAAADPVKCFSCGMLSAYSYRDRLFKFLPVRTVYPIGKSSKVIPSIRNEYFQFPFTPIDNAKNWDDFWSALDSQGWDRIMFNDILKNSADHLTLMEQVKKRGFTALNRSEETVFGIDVSSGNFAGYIQQLGKNTRIKLYNKRSKLNSLGKIAIKNMFDDKDEFVRLLNGFHRERWGKPCFSDNNARMLGYIMENSKTEGASVYFSVMTLDEIPISAVFDIKYGNRVYNLQSGYKENLSKGISLGTLHLGYQIEAAFNNPEVDYYDLMAGRGKHSNYKELLSNTNAEFANLIVFRKKWLPTAHRIKDKLREIKSRITSS